MKFKVLNNTYLNIPSLPVAFSLSPLLSIFSKRIGQKQAPTVAFFEPGKQRAGLRFKQQNLTENNLNQMMLQLESCNNDQTTQDGIILTKNYNYQLTITFN